MARRGPTAVRQSDDETVESCALTCVRRRAGARHAAILPFNERRQERTLRHLCVTKEAVSVLSWTRTTTIRPQRGEPGVKHWGKQNRTKNTRLGPDFPPNQSRSAFCQSPGRLLDAIAAQLSRTSNACFPLFTRIPPCCWRTAPTVLVPTNFLRMPPTYGFDKQVLFQI